MSSRDPRGRLLDIVTNAERAIGYAEGLDDASFEQDLKTLDAAERCLERIAEAIVKIGSEQMARIMPDLPVERVKGLGNRLRHAYDDIEAAMILNVIRCELPRLRDAAARALED